MSDKKTLLLIDSHALIHRAYHAFPKNLTIASGEVVNAVYGFATLLLDVLDQFEPDYVIATLDAGGKTVRHQQYGAYKANRSKPDDLLVRQIPMIEELLEKFDIPMLKIDGYEADDLIGTLDTQFSNSNHHTIIVTGDKDLFQLVDHNTSVFLAGTSFSKSKLYDEAGVEEKMGVKPEFITDIKALQGDSSDNIPGVSGVGKKGAAGMVQKFGHLDNIYQNIDKVKSRYQNKLQENYEMAKLSKELATIITDVPINIEFSQAQFGTYGVREIRDYFQNMQFNSLLRKLDKMIEVSAVNDEEVSGSSGQLSLMGSNKVAAKADLTNWEGQQLGETIFIHSKIKEQGDPLQWSLQDLIVASGDFVDSVVEKRKEEEGQGSVFKVESENISSFVKQLQGKRVVGVQLKGFLHCIFNRLLENEVDFSTANDLINKAEYWDLNLTTYLISHGRTKQELDSVLSYYKLGYADKFVVKLAKIIEAYHSQADELNGMEDLIQIEMQLLPVVTKMERNGITLDTKMVADYRQQVENKLAKIESEIYESVGHEFNIASPKQVGEVLFEEKGLPAIKKTKSGNYSTSERVLREIIDADPTVPLILEWREFSKLLSTYIKPLPKLVNKKTGRIHATFNQMGAVTGRFSSQDPNLQNIPIKESEGINMRKVFAAQPGHVLVAFDYSQQELRLLAELSKEPDMLKAFKSGKDIHAVAASDIFEIPIDQVTKEQRRVGKTINFGIVYGISPYGLSDRLKIDKGKAADYIDRYFQRYPKVREYYDELLENAKQEGEVSTILGRRRNTAELNSRNYGLRSATEREVMNFPLQGSAADLIKKGMVSVSGFVEEYPVKLLLQVHDELIFEYSISLSEAKGDDQFNNFVTDVQQAMLQVASMSIPLAVEAEIGENWASLEPLDVEEQ